MAAFHFKRVLIVLLIPTLLLSCNNAATTTRSKLTDTTISASSYKPTDTTAKAKTLIVTELPVTVLHSIDGGAENNSSISANHYPTKETLEPDSMNSLLGAYGIAYEVWVAPKGWTGDGVEGGDGNVVATLYPHPYTGTSDSTLHVSYYEVPACLMCMLENAALYFPGAMKEYNEEYNKDHTDNIVIPADLKIKRISRTLVTYAYPVKHNLLSRGVAYYRPSGDYYAEASFVLPENDTLLADLMTKIFIKTRHLD